MKRLSLVESYVVVDECGNSGNVEKRMVGASPGRGYSRMVTLYYLQTGELVSRVSTDEFLVMATGARWCRVKA